MMASHDNLRICISIFDLHTISDLRLAQNNIAKILLIVENFRNRFLAPDILSSR